MPRLKGKGGTTSIECRDEDVTVILKIEKQKFNILIMKTLIILIKIKILKLKIM